MSTGGLVYSSPVNFLVTQTAPPISTIADASGAISQLYQAMQQVILTFTNYCGIAQQPQSQWSVLNANSATILRQNLGRLYVTASENILQGAMISLWNNGGKLNVRNANATDNTKICDGYCSTVGGIVANVIGEVILGPGIASVSGLTAGTRYYLSTSSGLITTVAPSGVGNIAQYIGVAIDANDLYCSPSSSFVQH